MRRTPPAGADRHLAASSARPSAAAALALLALLALPPGAARADEGAEKGDTPAGKGRALTPGASLSGTVATGEEASGRVVRFWFHAPENAVMARVDVEGRADVDIFVARKPIDDLDDLIERTSEAAERGRRGRRQAKDDEEDPLKEMRLSGDIVLESAETESGTEQLLLLRDGGLLAPGDHFVAVAYRRQEPPKSAAGQDVEKVEFKVKLLLVTTRVDAKLESGKPIAGRIEPDQGPFRTYTVEVPPSAKCLRIDLFDAPQDLNLRLRKGKPMLEEDDAEAEATRGVGTEAVLVEPVDGEPIAGTWYVDVVDPNFLEFATPFQVRASFAKEPDPSLLVLPKRPAGKTPLEKAAFAVVELLSPEGGGGSGVLISESGYLLTNYHVVQDQAEGDGKIGEPMIVAMNLDPRDTAKEAFRAKIVAVSPELDLALVKCETGLYGQPVPADYKFPAVPCGPAEKLGLGDGLVAVGYPAVGGTGSRVTITYTRGVVSGFERRGATLHIKTDAMINSGNSGGGVFNERHELIGFATETMGDDETQGQIGYVRPIWLVPAEWWSKAGVTPPSKAP